MPLNFDRFSYISLIARLLIGRYSLFGRDPEIQLQRGTLDEGVEEEGAHVRETNCSVDVVVVDVSSLYADTNEILLRFQFNSASFG